MLTEDIDPATPLITDIVATNSHSFESEPFFKFKRIDQAIEASLNIEKTFGDEPAEIDGNKPKRAKVSGNFSKKYVK